MKSMYGVLKLKINQELCSSDKNILNTSSLYLAGRWINLFLWGDKTATHATPVNVHCGRGISSVLVNLDTEAMEPFSPASWDKHYVKYFCKVKISSMNSTFRY